MKLIKQTKLFYIEGKSDKIYEIDLCELSSQEFLVNFRYGRRGSQLKEGTKTPEAVSLEKAEAVFLSLENEKRKKGYQTDLETFIELPSLDNIKKDSPEGVILQRLQDAVEGTNSFKTIWKTSRVIWKAGKMGMQEAVPFIIKLASKGDDIQTYAALSSLIHLKVSQAEQLFSIYANSKQKAYIQHIAWEGLLHLNDTQLQEKYASQLLEKLPEDVRNCISENDYLSLDALLKEHSGQGYVNYFSKVYLLSKPYPEILPVVHQMLKDWPYKPPYFKQIRSIYKLAQHRNDFATLAILTYRFEKEKPMFKRTYALDYAYKQYVYAIQDYACIGKELQKDESRLAFSHFTKTYFQKNAVNYLKKTGQKEDAKAYIQLAVATLLQYTEADYTKAEERPYYEYGQYDRSKKLYSFLLYHYPECSKSLLLTTILFGNDAKRKLQSNLEYILGQRWVYSSNYYYNPDQILDKKNTRQTDRNGTSEESSVLDKLKSFFKKKNTVETKPEQTTDVDTAELINQLGQAQEDEREELFPSYWDAFPQAYVQLLMQANMHIIHQFAHLRLQAHKDFREIVNRFDGNAILNLLNRNFKLPNQFGYEVLITRKEEFLREIVFVGKVLDSNSQEARILAQSIISENTEYYTNQLEFVIQLIFNVRKENGDWIENLLQKTRFTEDRLQALLGKVVTELLQWENTDNNNETAKIAIQRINMLASSQLHKVSWDIVEQLIVSPLLSNILFASNITIRKSQRTGPTEIPFSLIELFLMCDIPEVREDGIKLLNKYPPYFLEDNFEKLLNLAENKHSEVVENILNCIRQLLAGNSSLGNKTIHHLVYCLIRKEKFEGAHALINEFIQTQLKPFWNTGLQPRDITKLIHAQYRDSQLMGYEIMKSYDRPDDFTVGQIISFGSHELLTVRQWCWSYYKQHVPRIRYEKTKSLNLMDSNWEDTRAFAFHFFREEFTEKEWDADTLISIVDSIRPEIETFGKELITRYFKPENALEYLTKLSEHPSMNVQAFVTSYLAIYATNKPEIIKELDFYFRSVLTRVNKGRVAKDRVYKFLHEEALKSEAAAKVIAPVLDDISAQSTIQDKTTCVEILTNIKTRYPDLNMHLSIL